MCLGEDLVVFRAVSPALSATCLRTWGNHDPTRRQPDAAKPAVEQHVVAIGDHKPILEQKSSGNPLIMLKSPSRPGGMCALC
jgi:hypothetical protein